MSTRVSAIGLVTFPELFADLKEVQDTGKYETCKRIRQWCGKVWRYVVVTGRAPLNIEEKRFDFKLLEEQLAAEAASDIFLCMLAYSHRNSTPRDATAPADHRVATQLTANYALSAWPALDFSPRSAGIRARAYRKSAAAAGCDRKMTQSAWQSISFGRSAHKRLGGATVRSTILTSM
jgi:hypothetical protein